LLCIRFAAIVGCQEKFQQQERELSAEEKSTQRWDFSFVNTLALRSKGKGLQIRRI